MSKKNKLEIQDYNSLQRIKGELKKHIKDQEKTAQNFFLTAKTLQGLLSKENKKIDIESLKAVTNTLKKLFSAVTQKHHQMRNNYNQGNLKKSKLKLVIYSITTIAGISLSIFLARKINKIIERNFQQKNSKSQGAVNQEDDEQIS
jgi:hypothetical protein